MENSNKVAHDIIIKLAEETEKDIDIKDPYVQKLILELNAVARVTDSNFLEEKRNQEFYSVKDVAELFDVNKQTVYKWIAEEKIEYEVDDSPGKIQRKGYHIPKRQFQTEGGMSEVDPEFDKRRKDEVEGIPNTEFDQSNVSLPKNSEYCSSHDDIKRNISRKKK